MKLTLLCYRLSLTSGQSRFLLNLARGLQEAGQEVSVCALAAEPVFPGHFAKHGIDFACDSRSMNSVLNQLLTIETSPSLARRLSNLAGRRGACDWYVILADEALGTVDYLPERRVAYISNGDLNLMFLNPAFYETERVVKRWLARGFIKRISTHREWAQKCAIRLGNSHFTRQLMAFTYALPFDGVVYPPVDTDMFKPVSAGEEGSYAVALVRNTREQNLDLLRRLAPQIDLRVVGGGTIPGATNMGILSDPQLVALLSGASVLAFPPYVELFGLPVLESMSCGTPAVAFDSGGPTELIDDGRNGWLVRSGTEFVEKVKAAASGDYPTTFREEARRKALRFSVPEMGGRMVSHLREGNQRANP